MQNQSTFITPPPFSFLREEFQKDPTAFLQFLFKTFPITECFERIWQMECAYMEDEQMQAASEGGRKDSLLFTHLLKALMEASYVMANNPVNQWYKKPKSSKNHLSIASDESEAGKANTSIENIQPC